MQKGIEITVISFFLLCSFFQPLHAAEKNEKKDKDDKEYVEKFNTRFYLKPFIATTGLNYTFINKNNNAKLVNKSFIPITAGFSINLLSIGFSHQFQFSEKYFNDTSKIQTRFRDFSFGTTFNYLVLEGYYQTYKRFYTDYKPGENTTAPASSFLSTDNNSKNIGGNMQIVFNGKKFSYKAAFNQSRIQKKPASSFLLMLYYNYNMFNRDNAILNLYAPPYTGDFNPYANMDRIRQSTWSLSLGYGAIYAYRAFYVAAAAYLGAGIQLHQYKLGNSTKYGGDICTISKGKFSMGANLKKFYTGVYANYDWLQSTIDKKLQTRQTVYNYGYFIGFRIVKEKKKKD